MYLLKKIFSSDRTKTISQLMLAVLGSWLFSLYNLNNVFAKIDNTNIKVERIEKDVTCIKDKYLKKDDGGISIPIGINEQLVSNTATVFKGNDLKLDVGNIIYIKNPFSPLENSIKVIITNIVEKSDPNCEAEIFVSKEAANDLKISKAMLRGVFKLKVSFDKSNENDYNKIK